jgi:hypothetical protein
MTDANARTFARRAQQLRQRTSFHAEESRKIIANAARALTSDTIGA